jgi:arsenate reductase
MKKIYYLKNCSTSQRIIKEIGLGDDFEYQNIKEEAITPEQLEEMKSMAGSYETLFSRRAMKYRGWGLNNMKLNEEDYRDYILKEYTFLKRPVIIYNDKIFVGSAKKAVEAAKTAINS